MAAKLLTSQVHLKVELMHNKTCRTSQLEIAAKTLMIKVDNNKEYLS